MISKKRKSRNPVARIQRWEEVVEVSVEETIVEEASVVETSVVAGAKDVNKKGMVWPAHSSITNEPGSSPYFVTHSSDDQSERKMVAARMGQRIQVGPKREAR